MFMIVLVTFSSTAIACLRTDTAQLTMKLRLARHKASTEGTKISAVAAELDALRHHLHHIFAQASRGADFAVAQAV
jgi:hypothetical protein